MTWRQLSFDLAPNPDFTRDNFLVVPSNEAAWRYFESWPAWPDRVLAVIGPSGSGKSHLAALWAERAGATTAVGGNLTRETTEKMIAAGAALLEDADRGPLAEDELFHFLNRAREENVFVVLTARQAPDAWGIQTPDLLSRLRLAPCVHLSEPDQPLLRAVLVKLMVDRQLVVDASLIEYAALRLDRSLDAARRFVDALDRESLALSRAVTRPFAARVLAAMTDRVD